MDAQDTVKTGAEKAKTETFKPSIEAEGVRATVDQFTVAADTAFKDGVEKALTALTDANTQSKKNLEAVVASVSAAARGAEALGSQAVAYSKTAFENQVNAAKALAAAKSPQELFELQTTFTKNAFEAYVGELGRMTETLTASLKDSFKPLNERVSEVVGRLQATR